MGNQANQLPKTQPKSLFFNLEQYKEKASGCACPPKARRGVQDSSEGHIPVQRSRKLGQDRPADISSLPQGE